MRERRRRAPVVGVAERSGEVKGRTGGLEAADQGEGGNPRISPIVLVRRIAGQVARRRP